MVDASANKKDIFSRFLETYKSNKKKVLSSFLALITILLLTLYINHSYKKKNIAVSNKFNNAKILIEKKNFVKSKIYLLEVIEAKNKFYSPAALYLIIENNLEKEQEIILELFDKILENKKIDKNNINLIKLKKVLFLFDLINEEEILNILNPIINSESLWKRNAIILLADYYKSKNEINKSEQLYKLLSTINKS